MIAKLLQAKAAGRSIPEAARREVAAAGQHTGIAGAVRSTLDGCLAAQRLVHDLRRGAALPDALHVALQAELLLQDQARLRAFARELQKALERAS